MAAHSWIGVIKNFDGWKIEQDGLCVRHWQMAARPWIGVTKIMIAGKFNKTVSVSSLGDGCPSMDRCNQNHDSWEN